MAEFYKWTAAGIICVTLLLALCVMTQTLTMVLSYSRRPRRLDRFGENLLELFVLFHIVVLSLLHGQLQHSYSASLMIPSGYIALRYVSAAVVSLTACALATSAKKARFLPIAAVSCLTLPLAETVLGGAYAWLYVAALFFWLLRGVYVCILRYREIRTGISALSVKDAIDSLRSGVLFSAPDGFVLLSNARMQRLMTVLTGKVHRNGIHFYQALTAGELQPGCERAEHEGQIVCLPPDASAWLFTVTELRVKRRRYTQLTATDISERWKLTAELRARNEQLAARQKELSEMIANLHILSRERETQRAKMRAHDILGERLTLMLYAVRAGQGFGDTVLLRSLSRGLIDQLKAADEHSLSPQDELDILKREFEIIGVEIRLDGSLPSDEAKGRLFVDIAREAATNAVRHGAAAQVYVQIRADDRGGCHMKISDNGYPPSGTIKEGGGIGGMRKKSEPFGGVIAVTARPCFVLNVDLPGEE